MKKNSSKACKKVLVFHCGQQKRHFFLCLMIDIQQKIVVRAHFELVFVLIFDKYDNCFFSGLDAIV